MALVQNGSEPASPRVARLTRRTEDTPITALGCSYVISAPNNVGIIFRSAAALGIDAVVLAPRCTDPLYRRAVKVSMGAVFAVPYARMQRWHHGADELRQAGFAVLALTPAPDAEPLDSYLAKLDRHAGVDEEQPHRVALVLGTEGDGLSAHWTESADARVRIPIRPDVDSLNVAAAAAIACYLVAARSCP